MLFSSSKTSKCFMVSGLRPNLALGEVEVYRPKSSAVK